ncbi:rRNA-processing protein CGR1, partial [Phenoliferia sp. Uapishka_3]
MVPQPLSWTGPSDPRLVDPTIALESDEPVPALPFLRNTSGRPWKQAHGATVRTQAPKVAAGSAWTKRLELRKKEDAVKKLEKDMKAEKAAEVERKRAITKERKDKMAEKLRLEEMATRMSARKLQRMKKRMGRSKLVAQ